MRSFHHKIDGVHLGLVNVASGGGGVVVVVVVVVMFMRTLGQLLIWNLSGPGPATRTQEHAVAVYVVVLFQFGLPITLLLLFLFLICFPLVLSSFPSFAPLFVSMLRTFCCLLAGPCVFQNIPELYNL